MVKCTDAIVSRTVDCLKIFLHKCVDKQGKHTIENIRNGSKMKDLKILQPERLQLAIPGTSGRLSTSVCAWISGIVWVTSVSYNWSMVSKVTVSQMWLAVVTQTIPDILASNTSTQSSRSFFSFFFF